MDVVIRLSGALATRRIYPPVDPITSRSALLDSPAIGPEHREIRDRVRETLRLLEPDAPPGDGVLIARGRRLQRFFAQPFYCAEPYTNRPGVTVSVEDALRGCREILDGVHDSLPEDAFYFTGGIDDVVRRAAGG